MSPCNNSPFRARIVLEWGISKGCHCGFLKMLYYPTSHFDTKISENKALKKPNVSFNILEVTETAQQNNSRSILLTLTATSQYSNASCCKFVTKIKIEFVNHYQPLTAKNHNQLNMWTCRLQEKMSTLLWHRKVLWKCKRLFCALQGGSQRKDLWRSGFKAVWTRRVFSGFRFLSLCPTSWPHTSHSVINSLTNINNSTHTTASMIMTPINTSTSIINNNK